MATEEDTADQTYNDQVTGADVVEGNLNLRFRNGSTLVVSVLDEFVGSLPTEDPEVEGALWNDGGTMMVSAGGA